MAPVAQWQFDTGAGDGRKPQKDLVDLSGRTCMEDSCLCPDGRYEERLPSVCREDAKKRPCFVSGGVGETPGS